MGSSTVSVCLTQHFLMVRLCTWSSKKCFSIATIEIFSMHLNFFKDEPELRLTMRKRRVRLTLKFCGLLQNKSWRMAIAMKKKSNIHSLVILSSLAQKTRVRSATNCCLGSMVIVFHEWPRKSCNEVSGEPIVIHLEVTPHISHHCSGMKGVCRHACT